MIGGFTTGAGREYLLRLSVKLDMLTSYREWASRVSPTSGLIQGKGSEREKSSKESLSKSSPLSTE
jgi:hypothetical protein